MSHAKIWRKNIRDEETASVKALRLEGPSMPEKGTGPVWLQHGRQGAELCDIGGSRVHSGRRQNTMVPTQGGQLISWCTYEGILNQSLLIVSGK